MEITIGSTKAAGGSTHTGPVPDSVQIGDGTDLLGVNADGSLNVKSTTLASETTLASINTKTPALVSGRVPVDVGASIAIDVADVGFNVNNWPSVQPINDNGGSLTIDDGAGSITVDDGAGSLTVDGTVGVNNFPAVYPVTDNGGSLTVDGTVGINNWPATQPVSLVTQPLPTGAATEATLSTIATNTTPVLGATVIGTYRNSYSAASVTGATWTQVTASLSGTVRAVEIFDSSGQTMELGQGAAAAETRLILIFPGGNGRIPLTIASSTRVSIRAVSGTASSGEICINFYG